MVANGEAMGFVSQTLEELKAGTVLGQDQRFGLSGLEDLFSCFRQSYGRDLLQAILGQHLQRCVELALPAVNDDEVGQVSPRFF